MALMTFIWWALTEGDSGSLWAGLPFAAAAAVFWCLLNSPIPVRIGALSLFFIYFVLQSLKAGIDVSLRVMRPSLPINPAVVDYALRLPEGPSRVFLSDTLNLMPGTLNVKMSDESLEIHLLDADVSSLDKIRNLENRVAAVFGHQIS